MTRDEAVSQIQQILVFRSDRSDEIVEGLKFQQQDLENQATLPWFLREEDTVFSTIDQREMAVPEGFIREWDDDALWIQRIDDQGLTKYDALWKDTPKFLQNSVSNTLYDSSDARRPVGYSVVGSNFLLYPTPDEEYTFRAIFYKKDELLNNNIENKWLKHLPYLLIGKAGLVIATALRDKEAQQMFLGFIINGTKQLNDVTTDRDMAGTKLVIGGGD